MNLQINEAPKIEPTAEAVVLAASALDGTNSLEQPQHIVPRTEMADNLSAN